VWKKDSNIVPSLFFSHFFGPYLFLFDIFSFFPHMGQCSNNEDHHTFIYLQLKTYKSILRPKYDYMNAPGGVPGCAMNKERHIKK